MELVAAWDIDTHGTLIYPSPTLIVVAWTISDTDTGRGGSMDTDTKETQNVKQMRETIERQNTELTELRQFRQDTVVADSGLHGPALKAVLKDIDRGDYKGSMTKDDIQEYAREEYEWEPIKEVTPPPSEQDPVKDLIDEGEKELEDLDRNGAPPPVKDLSDKQTEAQAEGNFLDAARLGVASQMDQLMGLSNKK